MAFEELEPLRRRDGTGEAHGTRRGFADGRGLREKLRHFFVELLLYFRPIVVDRGGGAGLDAARDRRKAVRCA